MATDLALLFLRQLLGTASTALASRHNSHAVHDLPAGRLAEYWK